MSDEPEQIFRFESSLPVAVKIFSRFKERMVLEGEVDRALPPMDEHILYMYGANSNGYKIFGKYSSTKHTDSTAKFKHVDGAQDGYDWDVTIYKEGSIQFDMIKISDVLLDEVIDNDTRCVTIDFFQEKVEVSISEYDFGDNATTFIFSNTT